VTEPIALDAEKFFEFMAGPGLKVIFVSVHPRHSFNRALSRQLAEEHKPIALGTVGLRDLVASGGPAVRFLHAGLRACGAPSGLGVLPGYYLFRGRQMLAWDAGVPTFADVQAMGRSALVGAIFSGVTRDVAFVQQAIQLAVEQLAAQRVAARFRDAAANWTANSRAEPSGPPPIDDLKWAYATLGVGRTATDREVHAAWRWRRMENHPDHARDAADFARRSRISVDINRARDIIVEQRAREARRTAYHGAA